MNSFAPHRLRRSDAVAALALAVVTVGVYAPAAGFDFVNYDDNAYVFENPHVLGGPTPDNLWWAATTFHAANWHPLTWLSLQFDAAFWRGDPAGYHLTNVLLHALNTVLLYLVFRAATGAAGRALALAALWGLHPLHVESVAWVSERKDVLCAFFWFLAMGAYLRYAAAPSGRRFLPVVTCCALALAAKPMAVTLPFALLLFDVWPLGRLRTRADLGGLVAVTLPFALVLFDVWPLGRLRPRSAQGGLVAEKRLLFLLVAVSCGVTFCAQAFGGAVSGWNDVDAPTRATTALGAYATYLGQTAWPTDLVPFYPISNRLPPAWHTSGQALALLGLTGAAVALRRPAPYFLVGWLWFLGTLVPVIGLVHVGEQAHADRYTYLPHVGLFAALVWGAADLAGRVRAPVAGRGVVAAALVAALAVVTRQQLGHWRDGRALWEHAVATAPDDVVARITLGKWYLGHGDAAAALRQFDEVLQHQPDHFDANRMKAIILLKRGQEPLPPK